MKLEVKAEAQLNRAQTRRDPLHRSERDCTLHGHGKWPVQMVTVGTNHEKSIRNQEHLL